MRNWLWLNLGAISGYPVAERLQGGFVWLVISRSLWLGLSLFVLTPPRADHRADPPGIDTSVLPMLWHPVGQCSQWIPAISVGSARRRTRRSDQDRGAALSLSPAQLSATYLRRAPWTSGYHAVLASDGAAGGDRAPSWPGSGWTPRTEPCAAVGHPGQQGHVAAGRLASNRRSCLDAAGCWYR